MKRYIKANSERKDSCTFRIYVDVFINNPYNINAASESDIYDPVTNDDGTINMKALNDWELFVQRVALRLKHIFKIVNIDTSPPESSLTSRYFWVYGRNNDGTINIEVLIRLRLSDHYQSEDHSRDDEYMYVDDAGQRYKHPEKIKHQITDIAEITVKSGDSDNEDTYHTYTEAMRGVYKRVNEIMDELVEDDGESVKDWCEDVEYKSPEFKQEDYDAFTQNYKKAKNLE